jgi:putative membrane protein
MVPPPDTLPPRDRQLLLAEQRTLLAAERTFSAWIRTGLSAIAGGIAVIQLFTAAPSRSAAHLAGLILIFWGAAMFIYALLDYRRVARRCVPPGDCRVNLWIFGITVAALMAVTALLYRAARPQ